MPLPGPRFASATVVEDGAGKADSNTYVGVHEADLWFSNDPGTVEKWDALTMGQKEWMLRKASVLVDQLVEWDGAPSVDGQAMCWPRADCRNRFTGLDVDPERVPDEVLQAVIETALNLATDDRVRAGGETRWSQIAVAGAVTLIAESDKGTAIEAKALMPLHARRLVSRFGDLLEPIGSVRSRKLNRA
jgi:hypothetical protein